ncbi:MAG: NCS2 family permease [Proteobacteria bacterium]|nr:NCS2 family permease [Pseudomonadota bacterium]
MKILNLDSKVILREAIAGVTTFFTMAYIIFVNPTILATPGTGMSFEGVLTATVLLSFSMTLLMGLYGKLPFAVAPGMGINAFFAYTLIIGQKIPFPTALGMIFWAGVFFVVVSITPLRVKIAEAIPVNIRLGSAVGIGIFLSFIGLKNSGLIMSDPITFIKVAPISTTVCLSFFGFAINLWLLKRKNPFAFLAGILVVTLTAFLLGKISAPLSFFKAPDFSSVFLKLDILSPLKLIFLPAIISILFTDLFDSISTFIGVAEACNLKTESGEPYRLKQGLLVDAIATMTAGILGTSSGTAFIESSAGIEVGGRTGLTAVFTAVCFIPCLFLSPLATMVPSYATAPVLILVGALMFRTVGQISFTHLEEAIPAYLTIILIPLTFSITQGLLWGLISHVVFFFLAGRKKEISPMLLGLAIISVGLLAIESWK